MPYYNNKLSSFIFLVQTSFLLFTIKVLDISNMLKIHCHTQSLGSNSGFLTYSSYRIKFKPMSYMTQKK